MNTDMNQGKEKNIDCKTLLKMWYGVCNIKASDKIYRRQKTVCIRGIEKIYNSIYQAIS